MKKKPNQTARAGDASKRRVVRKASAEGARALVAGVARLVEGQRCFADEFGLNYSRVFSDEYESFKGQSPEKVVRQWLLEGEEGAGKLQRLLDDLLRHQLALIGGLEGVARQVVVQLSPEEVEKQSSRILGLRPFVWRRYRRLHRRYLEDQQIRLKDLVIGGFVSGYVQEREKHGRK